MAMQHSQSVATDETSTLISSDKVDGTAVYNREAEKLGSIHTLMIDKVSGKVAYAVMSFGGFLGIGDRYHPLPWNVLTYDTSQGGYVVDLDRSRLEGAPTYASSETPNWGDRRWNQQVYDYYGARPYWDQAERHKGGGLPRGPLAPAARPSGDATLAAEGKSDKVEGKTQNAIGGSKDALKKERL